MTLPLLHVVVINGFARSGKDYFVSLLHNAFGDDISTSDFSMIDDVKRGLERGGFVQSGAEIEKTPALRKFWATVGDAAEEYNGFKTNALSAYTYALQTSAEAIENFNPIVVFVHCREPAMIRKIQSMFAAPFSGAYAEGGHTGVTTVFVRNAEAEKAWLATQASGAGNPNDAGVMDFAYDVYIENPYQTTNDSDDLDHYSSALEERASAFAEQLTTQLRPDQPAPPRTTWWQRVLNWLRG